MHFAWWSYLQAPKEPSESAKVCSITLLHSAINGLCVLVHHTHKGEWIQARVLCYCAVRWATVSTPKSLKRVKRANRIKLK